MNIYEIDRSILALVDAETGEITDIEAFEQLQMEREEKIENVALWIKNLTAESAAIKAEEENLKSRRDANDRKVERLKEYLNYALGGNKYSSARVAISYRASESVEVNTELCPKKYLVKTVTVKPDKKAIKQMLKDGKTVKGCTLVSKQNIQIK